MPKLKTHKGLSKRIRKTKSGKLKHVRAMGRHKMITKNSDRKRKYKRDQNISKSDNQKIRRMLPY
jgi:large subunit ribosomal protein L35